MYAVVFMDAIHFHARNEGRIVKRAVYIAIGIDMEGRKDVLGMYVGQNESAKFWLSILNGLKNRGVEDILIACVDGLTGFPQAIEAVFPQTEIQQCIIHQIRKHHEICFLQRDQTTYGRSEACICSSYRRSCIGRNWTALTKNGAGNTLRLQSRGKITGQIFQRILSIRKLSDV